MHKRILVTGANRGIGLEFVRQAAANGSEVVATARDVDKAQELAQLDAQVIPLDVGVADSVDSFERSIEGMAFDLVIHNAGVYGPRQQQSLDEMDYDAWLEVFNVNTLGALRIARATRAALLAGDGKTFVALSSKMGSIDDTSGGYYAYRSSKAALNVTIASLAQDWRPLGVAVAVLHPGWVRTDMGGPSAILGVEESVTGMFAVIDGLSLDNTGGFFNYDGSTIPW